MKSKKQTRYAHRHLAIRASQRYGIYLSESEVEELETAIRKKRGIHLFSREASTNATRYIAIAVELRDAIWLFMVVYDTTLHCIRTCIRPSDWPEEWERACQYRKTQFPNSGKPFMPEVG